MFTTQWMKKPRNQEKMSTRTLVSNVRCQTNQDRIAQALMAGSLIEANNIGFDIRNDEEISDAIFNVDKFRGLDITHKLEYAGLVREKVQSFIKGKMDEKAQNNAVPQNINGDNDNSGASTAPHGTGFEQSPDRSI